MRLLHNLATYGMAVFSVIHIAMAPVFFDQFTVRVMWYVAQGFMGLFVAFLNLASHQIHWREPAVARLTHVANLLALVFAIVYSVVDPAIPSFVGIALFITLLFSAFFSERQHQKRT